MNETQVDWGNDCGPSGIMWAEENGALADNTYEWALGNGLDNGRGITQACSGTITAVSLTCGTAGTNTNVSIQVQSADVGCNIVITGNSGYGTCNHHFTAGQYLIPKTITAGSCANAITTWWVKYDA